MYLPNSNMIESSVSSIYPLLSGYSPLSFLPFPSFSSSWDGLLIPSMTPTATQNPLTLVLLIIYMEQTQLSALAFQILTSHSCVGDFVKCWVALTERIVLPQTDEIPSPWGWNFIPLAFCPLQFPQKLVQFLFKCLPDIS